MSQPVNYEDFGRRYNRRRFLRRGGLIAGGLLLTGSIGYFAINDYLKISFEEARANPALRERYVEQVVGRLDIPHYVVEIDYISSSEKSDFDKKIEQKFGPVIHGEEYMRTIISQSSTGLPSEFDITHKGGYNSHIFVYPFAFESDISSDLEFRLTLTHELQHAKRIYKLYDDLGLQPSSFYDIEGLNKDSVNEDLYVNLGELDANASQINNPDFFTASEKYKYGVIQRFGHHYTMLWVFTANNPPTANYLINYYRRAAERANILVVGTNPTSNEAESFVLKGDKKFVLP